MSEGIRRHLPGKAGPVIVALALFALFVLALTGIATLAVHLQSLGE